MPDYDSQLDLLSSIFPDREKDEIFSLLLEYSGDASLVIDHLINNTSENNNLVPLQLIEMFPHLKPEQIYSTYEDNKHLSIEEIIGLLSGQKQCEVSSKKSQILYKASLADLSELEYNLTGSVSKKSGSPTQVVFQEQPTEEPADEEAYLDFTDVDMNHDYRAQAKHYYNLMVERFEQAMAAFKVSNLTGKASASFHSEQGRVFQQLMHQANKKASAQAFLKNNPTFLDGQMPSKIDLHGLTVTESIGVVKECIRKFIPSGSKKRITVITGVGIHSAGDPRLKPALKALCKQTKLKCIEDHGELTIYF
jgi:hypothetical protein